VTKKLDKNPGQEPTYTKVQTTLLLKEIVKSSTLQPQDLKINNIKRKHKPSITWVPVHMLIPNLELRKVSIAP